jgi:hypothetical protein
MLKSIFTAFIILASCPACAQSPYDMNQQWNDQQQANLNAEMQRNADRQQMENERAEQESRMQYQQQQIESMQSQQPYYR